MSGNRGEAAGVGGGLQLSNSRLASVPASIPSSIIPSVLPSGTMTRLTTPVSDNAAMARTSNGLPIESRSSIVDLLNSSSSFAISGHHRTSSMTLESGIRKRKLSDMGEDVSSRRRRIAEHKAVRLKRIQKDYVDHVTELLTLEGCSLPDMYRKRPAVSALLNYLHHNRLDPTNEMEDLTAYLAPIAQPLPQLDVKTAAMKSEVTPAVASTSVILNQDIPNFNQFQGFPPVDSVTTAITPSSPEKHQPSPHKNVTPNNSRASTPQKLQTSHDSALSSQEQIVEKAKQEAHVMQRIGELQREGLWAEKRLPKVQEPPRYKAHWDYLIEEMVWLAADFAQERKWKKAAAKKCAKMVQKYFQDKELMAQKAVRSQELQLKRIASCMAKEVKQFWANVEKLVEYKQQTRLEEKRKKALDQHLSFIVDQTEKYSSLVAESMNKTGAESVSHSAVSSRAPSPSNLHHTSDVEFEPGGTSSDDEETIAKAEAEEDKEEGIDKAKEIELLQKESELPLDELLKDYLDNREKIVLEEDDQDKDDCDDDDDDEDASSLDRDEEFRASDKDSSDDEETIQEQEKAEGKVDHQQELDELKAEGEMSIDELKAKYAEMQTNGASMEIESQVSDETEEDDENISSSEDDVMDVDEEPATEDLSTLLTEDKVSPHQPSEKDARDAEINDVAALAESIQPKGNTLSSTSVVTKIPFLLKHSLREYQHIGLDWLVTMHDRKLNGILADEMGLGKTIQTISVLAHLACEKGVWGPHLIVVPTSVMLNWEMEFKKWCPAFKILTYYGTQKERKLKRTGWTKPNAFHVCITSYKLVIQDHQSFRRKSWKYLILDEAQNIKNFKSQRWQLLLNFQTQRRLLLTGTPLQNNLMELWSLMHFLMPNVFQSHREFKEWFSNPVTGMIEGNSEYNEQIIKRLHKVLRPFLLRRLKCEVEKQLPKKYEHVVMCRLSNRQRYLYEDFMSRAKTKETLATGNLLSVINVLMQLRKVCNHPNLFEVRPTVSPFQMEGETFPTASCIWSALDYDPFNHVDLSFLNLCKVELELWMSAFMALQTSKLRAPVKLIEEIDAAPSPPPQCPKGRIKIHVNYSNQSNTNTQISIKPGAFLGTSNSRPVVNQGILPRVGPSNLMRTAITNQVMAQGLSLRMPGQSGQLHGYSLQFMSQRGLKAVALGTQNIEAGTSGVQRFPVSTGYAQLVQTNTGRHILLATSHPGTPATVVTTGGQRVLLGSGVPMSGALTRLANPAVSGSMPKSVIRLPSAAVSSPLAINQSVASTASPVLLTSPTTMTPAVIAGGRASTSSTVSQPVSNPSSPPSPSSVTTRAATTQAKRKQNEERASTIFVIPRLEEKRKKWRQEKLEQTAVVNERRCTASPMYGWDLVKALRLVDLPGVAPCNLAHDSDPALYWHQTEALSQAILSVEDRLQQLKDLLNRFVFYVPAVRAPLMRLHVSHPPRWKLHEECQRIAVLERELSPRAICLHPIRLAMLTQFPDPSLIQYDCGKLQALDRLLRQLKSEHHRVLIFTQMTRMLDVLEAFLNFHGHIYLRLDGTTKVDQRQVLMERFNGDKRIFCFILSTRSGGVGVNLTGADTVIFYDSDWNPTMDAQAQDRCHRIGQTRDVHIYRLVSEKTVEENILKKANQKRMLGDLAIEGGNFTTAYFRSSTIQDLFNVDVSENDASTRMAEILERDAERRGQTQSEDTPQSGDEKAALGALESALAAAEDETDVAAAKTAKAEAVADLAEFDETIPLDQDGDQGTEEISKAEQEVNALIQQLSGIERYAMKFIEETESAWSAEQLAAAEAEIEQQKREWEEERLSALRLQADEEKRSAAEASEELLTYSREDAQNQVNNTPQPRTRSRATVHIDLWTLDDSPIQTNQSVKKEKSPKSSPQVEIKKEKKILNNSSTSSLPVPVPYSNPNLVIRTRRASSNPVVGKGAWDMNHMSDTCLVGRKVARLNKAKRRSASVEGNGPVL